MRIQEEVIVSTAGQQVTLEYKGMSFSTHPRDMLYVYRLKGYASDWQPATRKDAGAFTGTCRRETTPFKSEL